jgi:hypothetical protein
VASVGACPTPRWRDGKSYRCRSRRCPSCGLLWAGDARRKLLANVSEYGGDVVIVTVTAPGRDRLPTPQAMVRWNLAAPTAWRKLHSRTRQACTRRGQRVTVVSRTWEYQRRGALHVHVVLGVATARELAGAHAYAAELSRRRVGLDFGFVDRGRRTGGRRCLEVIPSERAARYVAKYLSPLDGEGKPTLSETVTRRDVPPHVLYVSRDLTLRTGVTMRSLRWARRCWVLKVDPATGETYHSMIINAAAHGQLEDAMKRLAALGADGGL